MRQPRPEAFHPAYRKRSPEAIDVAGVVPVKARPATPPPSTDTERTDEQTNAPTDERVNGRTPERANARTGERSHTRTGERDRQPRATVRYSFQFYPHQIQALKRLRAQKELAGEKVDLSSLARQAFERYLATEARPDERPNE
jgi:hypothetical protein